MSTLQAKPNLAAPSNDGRPKASVIKVIGWLMIVAAILPMAMAAHREGEVPLEVGFGLFAAGVVLVAGARWLRRHS